MMYGAALARVHETAFGDVAESAARMAMELVEARESLGPGVRRLGRDVGRKQGVARKGPRAVDLGCGAGQALEILADNGYQAWGCDPSPEMVRLARARVPEAEIVCAPLSAEVPAAEVILAAGEIISFSDIDVADFFRGVAAALAPNGVFLFDVASPGRAPQPTTASRKGRGWRVEATSVEDGDTLRRSIDVWWGQEHAHEEHTLRLLSASTVAEALEGTGLVHRPVGGYDAFGFVPGWDGYIVRQAAGVNRTRDLLLTKEPLYL